MTASSPWDPGEGPTRAIHDQAIHAAFEAVLTVDERHRIVMINQAALRMFRCEEADVLGSDVSRFIPPRLRQAHGEHLRRFQASGVLESPMGRRGQAFGVRSDGEEFPLEASVARADVPTPQGVRRYFTAVLRDLSELHKLENELEMLNARVRGILALAPLAVWITDNDRVVFANRSCAELLGVSTTEELIGQSIFDLLLPQSHESVRHLITRTRAGDAVVSRIRERIRRRDGSIREVEIAAAELPDHGRTVLQMVITDLTDRERAHADLARSHRQVRRLTQSLANVREEERRRLARELHDELGQHLTALKLDL